MQEAAADEVQGGRSLPLFWVLAGVLLGVLLVAATMHAVLNRGHERAATMRAGRGLLLGPADWGRWAKAHPSAARPSDLSLMAGTAAARRWRTEVAEVLGVDAPALSISTMSDTGTHRELNQATFRGYTFASGRLTVPYPAERVFGQQPYQVTGVRGGIIASAKSVALYFREDGRAILVSCPEQAAQLTLGTCPTLLARLLSSGVS